MHDAQEKDKDRKNDLRKSVYIRAAEEIVNAFQHLATLTQQDLTEVNIGSGLKGLSVAASQAGLIASSETSKAISELMSGFMESFFKLSSELMPLQDVRTDINILNGQYENRSANVQRLLLEMEERNKTGQMDQVSWDAIKQMFDFNQSECERISNERDSKWSEFNRLQLNFTKAAIVELKSISLLTIPALIGIRKEMDLETDEEEYKLQLEKQFNKMDLSIDSFLKKIEGNG